MTMRTITFQLSIALLLCVQVGVVHAGEFSMSNGSMLAHASAPVEVARDTPIERASPSSSGVESSSRFMRSAGVEATPGIQINALQERALDIDSATPSKAESNTRMGGAPATTVAPNRSRTGNRWQSLVPGAIK